MIQQWTNKSRKMTADDDVSSLLFHITFMIFIYFINASKIIFKINCFKINN